MGALPQEAGLPPSVPIEQGAPPSILRWMGSKRAFAGRIAELAAHTGQAGRYFEPFFGGGSVFFSILPRFATLGDSNPELVNAWRHIRDAHEDVWDIASDIASDSQTYYRIRDAYQMTRQPLLRAAYFVYLNRYCFNGIYRTNRAGAFNVPYGSKTGSFPSKDAFKACAHALAGAEILCGDFEDTLLEAGPGDRVYLDPPYPSGGRSTYGEYGYSDHSEVSIERIRDSVKGVASRGATIYLSLPARLSSAFPFESIDLSSKYRVAASYSRRLTASEVLIVVRPKSEAEAPPA